MLDHAADPALRGKGQVGPNAILQLKKPVAETLGGDALKRVLELSGVGWPDGSEMVPEAEVAQVHNTLNRLYPGEARQIRVAAGTGTGAYIRAHRIPRLARLALGLLPTALGERILTRAILSHAWTFCGSGHVTARRKDGDVEFAIRDNPLVDRISAAPYQCDWHVAVFRDLYTQLLRRDYDVEELACCGSGAQACRFRIARQ